MFIQVTVSNDLYRGAPPDNVFIAVPSIAFIKAIDGVAGIGAEIMLNDGTKFEVVQSKYEILEGIAKLGGAFALLKNDGEPDIKLTDAIKSLDDMAYHVPSPDLSLFGIVEQGKGGGE